MAPLDPRRDQPRPSQKRLAIEMAGGDVSLLPEDERDAPACIDAEERKLSTGVQQVVAHVASVVASRAASRAASGLQTPVGPAVAFDPRAPHHKIDLDALVESGTFWC